MSSVGAGDLAGVDDEEERRRRLNRAAHLRRAEVLRSGERLRVQSMGEPPNWQMGPPVFPYPMALPPPLPLLQAMPMVLPRGRGPAWHPRGGSRNFRRPPPPRRSSSSSYQRGAGHGPVVMPPLAGWCIAGPMGEQIWVPPPPQAVPPQVHELKRTGRRERAWSAHQPLVEETKERSSSTGPSSVDNSKQQQQHADSFNSNGGGGQQHHHGEHFELEEPFSDTDEEDVVVRQKRAVRPHLNLPVPSGRIRTLSGTVPPPGHSPVFGGPTMCLGCLEFFDLPDQTKDYVKHLMDEHQILITHIELIVDLKRYIEHWRHRFAKEEIGKLFQKKKPEEGDELFGKVEQYYLMSEDLEEDRQLREKLAMRRLEEVLACQQRERQDMNFAAQCLFCRYTARGNRSKVIHHLFMIHHLNLGSPENLVFLTEYLEHLREKLERNECIYCEKTYQDHGSLMEHMRKRGHREVNPKNSYYDKFYIINYLELGKKWLDVLAEDFEDNMAAFHDSDEEEEEDSWHEWHEDDEHETNANMVVCLFCDEAKDTVLQLLQHQKEVHKYDLLKTLTDLNLSFYERVKFINYIRKMSYQQWCFVCGKDDLHSWEALRKHLHENDHLNHLVPTKDKWDHEEYLSPVFENDNLLWTLESYIEEQAESEEKKENGTAQEEKLQYPSGIEVIPEELADMRNSVLETDPEIKEQLSTSVP